MLPPTRSLSSLVATGDNTVYENAAVGHQLGVNRDDMVALG